MKRNLLCKEQISCAILSSFFIFTKEIYCRVQMKMIGDERWFSMAELINDE